MDDSVPKQSAIPQAGTKVDVVDIHRVMHAIPHRYPFLLVDRVKDFEPDRRIVGVKNVSINEPHFQGHFPQRPVMPGVLIIEALAQTADELQVVLPDAVGSALRDGLREEAAPISRRLAEVKGLSNQMIRRLERLETDLLAERHARVDDLALLVDLIMGQWRGLNERLDRIEARGAPRRIDRRKKRQPQAHRYDLRHLVRVRFGR